MSRLRAAAVVAAIVLSAVLAGHAAADGMAVRFVGRVSWIAAQKMVVATDDSVAVTVGLIDVPQDEYQRLVAGDRVLVTGTLTHTGGVAATSIQPLGGRP